MVKTLRIFSVICNKLNKIRYRTVAQLIDTLSPQKTVSICGQRLVFKCPNPTIEKRVDTIVTKEPGTIEWIKAFEENAVFWDIGANIGTFSFFATLAKGCRCFAFEPHHPTFSYLCDAVTTNNLTGKINPYSIALSAEDGCNSFYVRDEGAAYSGNSFENPTDFLGRDYSYLTEYLAFGIKIDTLIERFRMPFPNYIKIDVDGLELKILKGSKSSLLDSRLKSVLIEWDESRWEELNEIKELLHNSGFALQAKESTTLKANGKCFNFIFARKN